LRIRARFPGKIGNFKVRFTLKASRSVLVHEDNENKVKSLLNRDVVWIGDITSPIGGTVGSGSYYVAERDPQTDTWSFRNASQTLQLDQLDPGQGDEVRMITASVTVETTDAVNPTGDTWPDLPLDPDHQRAGTPDSMLDKFAETPSNLAQARSLPIVIAQGDDIEDGLDV